jgi:hypothetical protein
MNENIANTIGILAIAGCAAAVVWLGAALARDPDAREAPPESGSDPLDPW